MGESYRARVFGVDPSLCQRRRFVDSDNPDFGLVLLNVSDVNMSDA